MADEDVTTSGPIFNGRADSYCDELADEIERDLAAQFYSDVMGTLNARIRHPTPYLETQITVSKTGDGRDVNDGGVVYGPWIEGVTSRNASTGFGGYHAFASAFARKDEYEKNVTVNALRRWVRALNDG